VALRPCLSTGLPLSVQLLNNRIDGRFETPKWVGMTSVACKCPIFISERWGAEGTQGEARCCAQLLHGCRPGVSDSRLEAVGEDVVGDTLVHADIDSATFDTWIAAEVCRSKTSGRRVGAGVFGR